MDFGGTVASAAFKKWVCRNVEDLRDYLHLQDWRIDCDFNAEDETFDDDNMQTVAHANVSSDYFKATFTFTKFAERLFKEKEYETLFQCITHEVCHIWTDPMRTFALKAASPSTADNLVTIHEQLTQRIALLVLRGIPEKSYTP